MKDKVKKGFTIVEIMIALAIFTIVVGAVHQVFIVGQRTWNNDLRLLDLQQSTRRGLDSVAREVRAARVTSITMPAGCDHLSFPENCNEVIFNPLSGNNIKFFYYSDEKQLVRESPTGTNCDVAWDQDKCRVLANDVAETYFCCSHGESDGSCVCGTTYDILEIRLRTEKEKTAQAEALDFSLRTKLKVRNE